MSEVDGIIFDDAGDAIGEGRGYLVNPEHDPLRAMQDAMEEFGRIFVRDPILLTRKIEMLPTAIPEVGELPYRSKGKGRKAHKAFQRKLGGGW